VHLSLSQSWTKYCWSPFSGHGVLYIHLRVDVRLQLKSNLKLFVATSAIRWKNWRCQTEVLQTFTWLIVGVLETTIKQLTTTSSRVACQSPLDHSIISGSSIINSCWCSLMTALICLLTTEIVFKTQIFLSSEVCNLQISLKLCVDVFFCLRHCNDSRRPISLLLSARDRNICCFSWQMSVLLQKL